MVFTLFPAVIKLCSLISCGAMWGEVRENQQGRSSDPLVRQTPDVTGKKTSSPAVHSDRRRAVPLPNVTVCLRDWQLQLDPSLLAKDWIYWHSQRWVGKRPFFKDLCVRYTSRTDRYFIMTVNREIIFRRWSPTEESAVAAFSTKPIIIDFLFPSL